MFLFPQANKKNLLRREANVEKYVNAHSFPAAKRNAGWKIQPSKTTKQTKPEKNQSVEDVGEKRWQDVK